MIRERGDKHACVCVYVCVCVHVCEWNKEIEYILNVFFIIKRSISFGILSLKVIYENISYNIFIFVELKISSKEKITIFYFKKKEIWEAYQRCSETSYYMRFSLITVIHEALWTEILGDY